MERRVKGVRLPAALRRSAAVFVVDEMAMKGVFREARVVRIVAVDARPMRVVVGEQSGAAGLGVKLARAQRIGREQAGAGVHRRAVGDEAERLLLARAVALA